MDVQAVLEAQRTAFRKGPPAYGQRIDALRKLERLLVDRKAGIIGAVSEDFGGRAAQETEALELFPTLSEIRHAIQSLKGWMKPRPVGVPWVFLPSRARILYQPLGVVGVVGAWNFPIFLAIPPLAGALAAGNHVMLKPSEWAPRTAELLRSMLGEAFPAEYVSVITGDASVAEQFTRLPFDHLLFTGSTRVGKLVMKAASENLTPVTLELGGKSPALIHPSYSIRKAAERILTGKLYNGGQTCVAPDYVLVAEGALKEFVEASRKVAAELYPRLVSTRDYTRIINARHYQRLAAVIADARAKGAEVTEINPAGEECNETNRVFPPTLVTKVTDDMVLMKEEIFGPVLPVVSYRSREEAIAYINDRPRPLALYYFDDNGARVREVLEKTTSGGVTVNDCVFHVGQPNLPFGGVGPSGLGRYHGVFGFDSFSNQKGVFEQGRLSSLEFLRPPYGEMARRILQFLVR